MQLKGMLVEEIKSAFEKLLHNKWGGYYPWFLQNQWVINQELVPLTNPVHKVQLCAWQYMGSSHSSKIGCKQTQLDHMIRVTTMLKAILPCNIVFVKFQNQESICKCNLHRSLRSKIVILRKWWMR